MADIPSNPQERNPTREESRLQPWVKGLIWGDIFWGLMFLKLQLSNRFEDFLPKWFELPNFLQSICMVLTYPVGVGGWLLIWGDNGPPLRWIDQLPFTIAFGLIFYGLLGAVIGRWIGKRRGGSRS